MTLPLSYRVLLFNYLTELTVLYRVDPVLDDRYICVRYRVRLKNSAFSIYIPAIFNAEVTVLQSAEV